MSKYYNFVWTLFNYNDDDIKRINQTVCAYLIYGKEICPTTKNPHLQGYVEFKKPISSKQLQKRIGGANKHFCEKAKGTAKQNTVYCKKGGDWFVKGTAKKQGKRTDLDAVRDLLSEGTNLRTITGVCSSLQSYSMGKVWLSYHEKPRRWKPEVIWLYGPTGSGKSKRAIRMADNIGPVYEHTLSKEKWWDGYDGHKVVILNDLRGSWCAFNRILNILDRYGCRVEVKGGSRQLLAKHIFITSHKHPREIWNKSGEDIEQLLRRIDHIIELKKQSLESFIKLHILEVEQLKKQVLT